MTSTIQERFEKNAHEQGFIGLPKYPLSGTGECYLRDNRKEAIVWIDGRYPLAEKGYSYNTICTETVTVVYGGCIILADADFILLSVGQTYSIKPHTKYSIAGTAICIITIDPERDSSQNSFIL